MLYSVVQMYLSGPKYAYMDISIYGNLNMWIYGFIFISYFLQKGIRHEKPIEDMQEAPIQPVSGSSVETVVEDPGYDHEGPGDVCGYVHPAQGHAEDSQVALCRT